MFTSVQTRIHKYTQQTSYSWSVDDPTVGQNFNHYSSLVYSQKYWFVTMMYYFPKYTYVYIIWCKHLFVCFFCFLKGQLLNKDFFIYE